MKIRAFGILAFFTVAGCQSDPNDGTRLSTVTRDSAGIQIVENAQPPAGSRVWQVGPEPAVSIGAREGEDPYMLYQVMDATKLSDGRIVVANSGDSQLRVFDAFGTHVATWGGQGEGPGEFQGLVYVEAWPGDSIIAWYAPRRGISVFDSEGNFGRTFTLEITDQGRVDPAAVIAGGTILAGQHPHVFERVRVEIRDPEGRLLSSLGEHPGDERYIANEGTDRSMMFQPVFGANAVRTPWGDLVVHDLNNRYEIMALAQDGSLARIVRRGHVPRSPTQEEIEAYIEERVSWNDEEDQAEVRKDYQSVAVAEHMPAFTSVIVDKLNHLWVEEYEAPGEERPGSLWTVFDPEGRVLGFVETPERLEIFEIGGDYILGRGWDDLYVEYVQVWPLER